MKQQLVKKIITISNQTKGAIAVEYALAMVLAATIIFAAVPVLFELSKELLELFVSWLQPHYP